MKPGINAFTELLDCQVLLIKPGNSGFIKLENPTFMKWLKISTIGECTKTYVYFNALNSGGLKGACGAPFNQALTLDKGCVEYKTGLICALYLLF